MTQLSFHYRATDPRGAKAKGVLQAESREEAYRQIVAAGMKPLSIAVRRTLIGTRARVTFKDIAHFTYQFSVLLQARIPIVDGLRSIIDQEQNARLREVMEDVARQIEGGSSVTDALSPYREMFGEVFVETVRAAEASGNMIDVLAQLATLLERQHEISKRVKGALLYPICVISAICLAVTFLMIFVVPKFTAMYLSRGLDLPLPTQVVVWSSEFVRSYWWVLITIAVGGFFALRAAWKDTEGRRRIDTALHRVPFVRDVLKSQAISRFANILGISLRSGLSLLDALEMAGRASARPLLYRDALKLRDQVNQGGRLSDVMLTCQYLPPFTRRMIAAGEEAGELPRMCEIVSRNYDREVEHLTRNVATVIEPILIVGLAGVVLLIALAIFLPMWNMAAIMG